jgi:hypothetical protein
LSHAPSVNPLAGLVSSGDNGNLLAGKPMACLPTPLELLALD